MSSLVAVQAVLLVVTEHAALAVRGRSRRVQRLEVALVAARPFLVALSTEIWCPRMALSTVLFRALFLMDLEPIRLQMVFGYILSRVALDALLARSLTVMTRVHAHLHRRPIQTEGVLVVYKLQVTVDALDFEYLDVRSVRDQKIAIRGDRPVDGMTPQTRLRRGRTKQVLFTRPAQELRVESGNRLKAMKNVRPDTRRNVAIRATHERVRRFLPEVHGLAQLRIALVVGRLQLNDSRKNEQNRDNEQGEED